MTAPEEPAGVDELNASIASLKAADAAREADRAREAERRAEAAERDRDMYREKLRVEEERLEKLWDAYKAQEGDLRAALERSGRLERELKGKDVTASEAESLLRTREEELRQVREALEGERARAAALEIAKAELQDAERLRDRVEELEALLGAEKERLAKLYVVYEELEAERDDLAVRLEEKEAWFRKYEAALKDITGGRPRT